MDLLKEILITFSNKKKKEFEKFLVRKRPSDDRRDITIFNELFKYYNSSQIRKINYKGNQKYHAIRKRLAKELINFIILHSSVNELDANDREVYLFVAIHFIEFKKYEVAWEILMKEELKCVEKRDHLLNMKIQRLKLEILPYYPSGDFEQIKSTLLRLQALQARVDEFQLYFIQVRNMFAEKLKRGDVEVSSKIISKALEQYSHIKSEKNSPKIHLKIIEIIRVEYAVKKNFVGLAKVLDDYYKEIHFNKDLINRYSNTIANIEYIMAYTFLDTRNFNKTNFHLSKMKILMDKFENVSINYLGRYVALMSFIKIFENKIDEAINMINSSIDNHGVKFSERELLNLKLNQAAFLCLTNEFKASNRRLLEFNKANSYYQKSMGREWIIRKEMIRAVVQLELKNIDIAEQILFNIESNHKELFAKKQYMMVSPFIQAFKLFINTPEKANKDSLDTIENEGGLNKHRMFRDPRLIIFYSWLKGKYTNQPSSEVLIKEFSAL